jgi:glycosyltransferase involved in cell wall biosynthesis
MRIDEAFVEKPNIHQYDRLVSMSIAAITGGLFVPSRRFRIEALLPYLAEQKIKVKEFCPYWSTYPPDKKWQRPAWFFAALIERFSYIARARGFDAVILQRELISTISTIERLIPGPRILDVDDAIFVHRGGRTARYAAQSSIGVVCGNEYLAERFSSWNDNICVIPTGVDIQKLKPISLDAVEDKNNRMVIGWIGGKSSMKYLGCVANGIERALKRIPNSEMCIISDSSELIPPELRRFTRFIQWHPEIECRELPKWTVGIMPLEDTMWARGKCAFKALQYMSAGIPVVASPVGMNTEVIRTGVNGILAHSDREWEMALLELLSDSQLASEMGARGRCAVEERYSLSVVAGQWRTVLDRWLINNG